VKVNYIIKYATAYKGVKFYGIWNIKKEMWVRDQEGFAAELFTSVLGAHSYAKKHGLK